MKKNLKNKQAITLVSLVITIIILLILAGVTLSLLIGENGLINRAKYAKEKYENAQKEEQKMLDDLYSEILIATNESSQITVNIQDLKTLIREECKKEIINAYPVGSIYISISETNPSELFGGEWERYGEGRTLIGAGTGTDINSISRTYTVGATGGEYAHRLTVSEMPSHSHGFTYGQQSEAFVIMSNSSSIPYEVGFAGDNNGWWRRL